MEPKGHPFVLGSLLHGIDEQTQRLTKFISIISMAVFIEGLVTVVRVSKQKDVEKMIYPTLLLMTAILIVIGLGLYQRLSIAVDQHDEDRANSQMAPPKAVP